MKLRIEQLNLYLLITYLLLNIVGFIGEVSLKNFIFNILPYIVGLILYVIGKGWKSLKVNYYLYVSMGLFITILGSSGNTSGVLFLCFALSLKHKPKDMLKIILLTAVSIGFKIYLQSLDGSKILNFLLLYVYLGMTYYTFVISPEIKSKSQIEKNYSLCNISKDVINIVSLRMQGFDYPEINRKLALNITDERVRRKVSDSQRKNGFKTKEQFILYLVTEKVISKSFIDKSDTNIK